MIDTDAASAAELQRRLAARTPGERMQMACSMFTLAQTCVRAGLSAQAGNLSEAEQRVLVLRRLHPDGLELDRSALEAAVRRHVERHGMTGVRP